MGVSESSVPHCTQWLMIIIPFLNGYFIGNINPTFSDKPRLDPAENLIDGSDGVQLCSFPTYHQRKTHESSSSPAVIKLIKIVGADVHSDVPLQDFS